MEISWNFESIINYFFSFDITKISWATFEGMLGLTHLMVLFGLRNSDLDNLRKNQIYFLEDGITHLVSIMLYSLNEIGIFSYLNWRLMLIVHIFCWTNLIFNPPHTDKKRLYKVYHWSCIECQEDRFDLQKFWFQIIGTTLDMLAHFTGFYYMLIKLNQNMQVMTIFCYLLSIVYFIFIDKRFQFHKHMMPKSLRRLIFIE